MRLTTVIFIASLMQVSATTLAQRITISQKNAKLESVLREIRKQSGYDFFYDAKLTENQKVNNVNLDKATIEDALNAVLKNLPLTFEIEGKTVSITRKSKNILENLVDRFQEIDVSGKIIDEMGNPLAGARVMVIGSGKSTVSNSLGDFNLSGVDDNEMIVVSFIGYLSREMKVRKNLGDILLEPSTSKLDEVQVEAYRTTTRRLATGNISTIKADVIEKQPVNNPLLALSGRLPGLQITQTSGLSGGAVKVRVQGQNSLSSGSDPYYIIDGVPYISRLFPNRSGSVLGTADGVNGNPLNYINPADIESIDVLKDADATAIYGSRAANGAILITTKKGKAGDTKVDLTIQNGWGKVARKLDMMNTQEYLAFRREALTNDVLPVPTSATVPSNTNYDFTTYDQNKNTDWQKELIGGTAGYTDIQTAVSGGNAMTSFRVNGGYHRETTVFPGDFADVKGAFGFNLQQRSANKKFTMQLSGSYLMDNNNISAVDLTSNATNLAPNAPDLYKADGSLNWQRISTGTDSVSTWQNPLARLLNKYVNKTKNLFGNGLLSYEILTGLELKATFGYNNMTISDLATSPLSAVRPETRATSTRGANFGRTDFSSWIIEPQLNFTRRLGVGKIDILAGATFQRSYSENVLTSSGGYNSDYVLEDIKSAASVSISSSENRLYKYAKMYARINYNVDDKYIVNFTGSRDGSSRFGIENQMHNFGAIGAAWVFSKEEFIHKNISFLSYGKLRASFGTTGNDQIGDYSFLGLYSIISPATPYLGTTGSYPNKLGNPFLQWEQTQKLQFGLDLGVLRDRILVGLNYYHNRSSNQLLEYTLPSMTGFNSIIRNFPATIQNYGWEFTMNSVNIRNASFSWTSSANLTIPRNKLVDFPGIENSVYKNTLVVGQPFTIQKVFTYAGVNPATGLQQYTKVDGSLSTSPIDNVDNTYMLSLDQKFYGGLQNNFSYKDFSLDFFFQFTKQLGANILSTYSRPGSFFGQSPIGNLPSYFLDRWQRAGDITDIQMASTTRIASILYRSNFYYSDASYVRLKNASLSYNLPDVWIHSIGLQKCRVFVQGQNLLTITKFKGIDPENQSTNQLPPLRVYTLGLQVSL